MNQRISFFIRHALTNKVVLAAASGFVVAAASAVTANAQINVKQVIAAGVVGAVGAIKLVYTEPPAVGHN